MTNINQLGSYLKDGKLYVNITMCKKEQKSKPSAEDIRKQHFNIENRTLSLNEFIAEIQKGKAWLPAVFSTDENGKIRLRLNNFVKSCMVVMDVDNGQFTMPEIHQYLKEQGIEPNFGYYTFSHNGKDKIRFRLGWVVGTIQTVETARILSQIIYKILDKYAKKKHLNAEKKVRRPKGAIMAMCLEEIEDDKSSYNPVQLWQGTSKNQKAFVWHNEYLDLKKIVDVMYTFVDKTHYSRITNELKEIGLSTISCTDEGTAKSDDFDCVDTVKQSEVFNLKDMGSFTLADEKFWSFSLWNWKDNFDTSKRKYTVDFEGEFFGSGDKETLYNRCKLLREMKKDGFIPGVDTNGHYLKRFITVNLAFLADGEEIMKDTVCKHSDKAESYWENEINRIRTDTPPVKCEKFCPYSNQCKYGTKTICTAAQINSFKDEEVIQKREIEEISLEEGMQKTTEYVDSIFDKYDEIVNGWEYGIRKKRIHPGTKEIKSICSDIEKEEQLIKEDVLKFYKSKGMNIVINSIYSKKFLADFKDDLFAKNYIFYEGIIKRINKCAAMNTKVNDYKKDIQEKRNELSKYFNVIKVPVGVGKTRAFLDKVIDLCKTTESNLADKVHVCYAAPTHNLATQFEEDLLSGLISNGIYDIEKLKIVRIYPRPVMLDSKDEQEIKSLESAGMSITKKVKAIMHATEDRLNTKNNLLRIVSEQKRKEARVFIDECKKFLDSRANAHDANILICTHKYLQTANIRDFNNIDLVCIDEDLLATSTNTCRISIEVLEKMKEVLETATYTYKNKTDCSFIDLINIIQTLLESEEEKFYTFDSSVELCSEISDNEVRYGMINAKYEELAKMRTRDKVNYMNLCKIKSYIKKGDAVYISSYETLDVGDKTLMMLSAYPSPEFVLEKLTNKDKINLLDVGFVKQTGTIIQTPYISASRAKLNSKKYREEIIKIINKYNPETSEIITFKSLKDSFDVFNKSMHLGATAGMNSISGQNLTVIGTYHINPYGINLFAAMFDKNYTVRDLEIPRKRKVVFNGIEQQISTYNYGNLREYHLWYCYNEMLQAMGRSRTCRTDATVLLISSLIYPQAELKFDTIKFDEEIKNNSSFGTENTKEDMMIIKRLELNSSRLNKKNKNNNQVLTKTEEITEEEIDLNNLPF